MFPDSRGTRTPSETLYSCLGSDRVQSGLTYGKSSYLFSTRVSGRLPSPCHAFVSNALPLAAIVRVVLFTSECAMTQLPRPLESSRRPWPRYHSNPCSARGGNGSSSHPLISPSIRVALYAALSSLLRTLVWRWSSPPRQHQRRPGAYEQERSYPAAALCEVGVPRCDGGAVAEGSEAERVDQNRPLHTLPGAFDGT